MEFINPELFETFLSIGSFVWLFGGIGTITLAARNDEVLPFINFTICFNLVVTIPWGFIGKFLEDGGFGSEALFLLLLILAVDCIFIFFLVSEVLHWYEQEYEIKTAFVYVLLMGFTLMISLIPYKYIESWKFFLGIICMALSIENIMLARKTAEDADDVFWCCISSFLSAVIYGLYAWMFTDTMLNVIVIILSAIGKAVWDIYFYRIESRPMIATEKYDPIYYAPSIKIVNPISKEEMTALLEADKYLSKRFPIKRIFWYFIIADWRVRFPDLAAKFSEIPKSNRKTALLNVLIYGEYAFMKMEDKKAEIATVTSDFKTVRIVFKKEPPILLPISRFLFDFDDEEGVCDTPIYDLTTLALTVPQIR